MKSLRILLAVGPKLFRGSLHQALVRRRAFKVIDAEPGSVEVLVAASLYRVDVVIITPEGTPETPPLVTHLLAEFPRIRVVALDPSGEYARIFRNGHPVRTASCGTPAELHRAIVDRA